MGVTDFTWRPIHLVLRFLLWPASVLPVWNVVWGTGGPVSRVLMPGQFAHAGFRVYEAAGALESIPVRGVGLAILGAALWSA